MNGMEMAAGQPCGTGTVMPATAMKQPRETKKSFLGELTIELMGADQVTMATGKLLSGLEEIVARLLAVVGESAPDLSMPTREEKISQCTHGPAGAVVRLAINVREQSLDNNMRLGGLLEELQRALDMLGYTEIEQNMSATG